MSFGKVIKKDYSHDLKDSDHFPQFPNLKDLPRFQFVCFLIRPEILMFYILGCIESFYLSYRFGISSFYFMLISFDESDFVPQGQGP